MKIHESNLRLTDGRKITSFEKLASVCRSRGFLSIGEYFGDKIKMEFVCSHGHKFDMSPMKIKRGHSCLTCSTRNIDHVKDRFFGMVEPMFKVLNPSEYKNSRTRMILECTVCGFVKDVEPKGCVKYSSVKCEGCNRIHRMKSLEEISQSEGYSVSGSYIDNSSKLDFMCPNNHHFESTYRHFVSMNNRCPICSIRGYNDGKMGYIYLYKWELGDKMFLKVGITNHDPDYRVSFQSRNTEFVPSRLHARQFDVGLHARLLEKFIMSMFCTGVVDKEVFPDGYTETIYYSRENVNKIVDIVDSWNYNRSTNS